MQTQEDLPGRRDAPRSLAPQPLPPLVELPESRGYRFKKKLLGPPLHTDQLVHERLGKPTALAVFASDNLSSVAYGTDGRGNRQRGQVRTFGYSFEHRAVVVHDVTSPSETDLF